MNGGSVPFFAPAATSTAADCGVAVFLGVRAVAVAVLEIQPEVLDRLALQLFGHAGMDAGRRVRCEAEDGRERARIRRMFLEHAQRRRAEPRGRVRLEQVRAAVNRVNRLPPMR